MINVANRQFKPDEVFEVALRATGTRITPAYFQLLDLPIREFIYHVELWQRVSKKVSEENDNNGGIDLTDVGE